MNGQSVSRAIVNWNKVKGALVGVAAGVCLSNKAVISYINRHWQLCTPFWLPNKVIEFDEKANYLVNYFRLIALHGGGSTMLNTKVLLSTIEWNIEIVSQQFIKKTAKKASKNLYPNHHHTSNMCE